jgi:ABC-2 type transport system permease protein
MRFEVILSDFITSLKTFWRSKGTMFWTIAFPILLILIFGAIFSGSDTVEYTLHIQDLDGSKASNMFIDILNETGFFNIKKVDKEVNVDSYIEDKDISRLIVIPNDYSEKIAQSYVDKTSRVNLSFYFDQSELTTNQVVRTIISSVLQSMNMNITGGSNIIGIDDIETITGDFDYIDFFIPGMIGFTIMTSCIYGSIERNTKYRKNGILRKLQTTPITRVEWIFSKMLFMVFLSFLSTVVILVIGILVYGLNVNLNILIFIVIIAESFLFSGMGMLIGRFVKEEETADTAGGAITFPMMFLAGTFFPLDQMPEFLQSFARILPLYYVNEALRNAMIYLNTSDALINTLAVIIFALVFFIAGLILTKWKED